MTLDADTIYARRWWTLSVLCLSLVMVIVGNTVLNVALPTLVRELDATNTELQWMVDAYSLVFAGLLLTSGALGDRFGRKHALTIGLVVFGVASAAAALSHGPSQIIAARAVMGIAASLVMPATLSILAAVFPPQERARAIAIWAGLAGAGAAIGPVAAGWLLEHFWWGSVFLLNVPIVVLALLGGRLFVPNSKDPSEAPLDPIGALLSIVGLGALVYGIIEAPNHGWTGGASLVAFGIALAGMVSFWWWERRVEHPMLDISFFHQPAFTAGSMAIMLVFFAMFGMFFLMTQYLQLVLGYDPLEAGIRVLPNAFMMMVVAPSSARVAERVGTKYVVAAGLLIVAAGLGIFQTLDAGSTYPHFLLFLLVISLGMGLTMPPSTAAIMASLPLRKAGVGSAVNDTTRELGGALGVAVLGSVVASSYARGVEKVLPDGLPAQAVGLAKSSLGAALEVAGRANLPDLVADARNAFMTAMHGAALIAAAVALLGCAAVLRYMPKQVAMHPHGGHTPFDDEVEAQAMVAVAKAESLEP